MIIQQTAYLLQKRETQSPDNYFMGKWEYNSQHLPVTYIDGSGQKTQYVYNSYGELTQLTDANSDVWTWTYNGNGYLTQFQGPLSGSNDVTSFGYDAYGRLAYTTDAYGYIQCAYSYDNMNRVTSRAYNDGTETIIYDKLDAVMMCDRLQRWTQRNYDSMDQLSFEVDPLGRKTQYLWCDCGSLASLTDPAGHATNWQHESQREEQH